MLSTFMKLPFVIKIFIVAVLHRFYCTYLSIEKRYSCIVLSQYKCGLGAQWLSGRVLDSRPRGRGFEPLRRQCVVSLRKNINPSLILVQPRN